MKGKLSKLIVFSIALVLIFSVIHPFLSSASDVKRMEVTSAGLNVRGGPSTSDPVTGYLKKGDFVDVIEQTGNWVKIEYQKTKKGYVHADFLKEPTINTTKVISTKAVTADILNVRQGPDAKYKIVGTLKQGTSVKVHTTESNNWGYVTAGNVKGYVNLSYVGAANASAGKDTTPTTQTPVTQTPTTQTPTTQTPTTQTPVTQTPTTPTTYTVQKGDTLYGISVKHKTTVAKIKEWNKLKSDSISVGQKLIVSDKATTNTDSPKTETPKQDSATTTTYTVQSGDTLYGISAKHKTTVDEIKTLNKLTSNVLYVGQKLVIKGTANSTPSTQTPTEKPKEETKTRTVYVTASNLTVRTGPSVSYPALTFVTMGASLTAYETTGDWTKVAYTTGKTGYVHNAYITETKTGNQLKGVKIVVDPGHGGGDPGAIGNGYYEKHMVLSISKKLQSKLQNAGATVIMTRSDDTFYSLSYRSTLANNNNADLFISVHENSATDPSASGIETYWYGSTASKNLATYVQNHFISQTGAKNRSTRTATYSVLVYTNMPAILVEVGFISNKTEADLVANDAYQNKLAEAMYQGVLDYYK